MFLVALLLSSIQDISTVSHFLGQRQQRDDDHSDDRRRDDEPAAITIMTKKTKGFHDEFLKAAMESFTETPPVGA